MTIQDYKYYINEFISNTDNLKACKMIYGFTKGIKDTLRQAEDEGTQELKKPVKRLDTKLCR